MTRKAGTVILALVAAVFILLGCEQSFGQSSGSMDDLEPAIAGLLASPADDAFLIVNISGTDDFVQMAGYRGTAELDFPQITDRQKGLRPMIEKVCEELGLTLRVVRSPNGLEFLDYELPADAAEIARILRTILSEVYAVTDTMELEFDANGFELPAA